MSSVYGGGRQETERKVSSVVLREELLGPSPVYEPVRYVEIPVIEEVIRHVPRREIVEIEKRVPKIEYKYVDRIVEVPQIEYVDRLVEVPQIQEDIRYVDVPTVVDVPKEIIERIPRVETRVVEKVVDVPGEIIEVPKPYRVEKEIKVPRYVQQEHPVIVEHTVRPEFTQSDEAVSVPVTHYSADVVEVIVPVAKIVDLPIRARGVVDERRHRVELTAQQYNSYLRSLNPHLTNEQIFQLPFHRLEREIYGGANVSGAGQLHSTAHAPPTFFPSVSSSYLHSPPPHISGTYVRTSNPMTGGTSLAGSPNARASVQTHVATSYSPGTYTGSTVYASGARQTSVSGPGYDYTNATPSIPANASPLTIGAQFDKSHITGTSTVNKSRGVKNGNKRPKSVR